MRFGTRMVTLGAIGVLSATALSACGGGGREAAAGSGDCSVGFTDTTVALGSSQARSGVGAAYAVMGDTLAAYFDDINADGGVKMADGKKRKITFTYLDDAYDPARAVSNVRRLVEQEKVAAIIQPLGTSPVLAFLEYATSKKTPVLFPASGSNEFLGLVADGAMLTGASMPKVDFEIQAMVSQMVSVNPEAKVGVLYGNDGLGKGSLAALQEAIKDTDIKIVGSQAYESTSPSVDSQVVALRSSGADTLVNFGVGGFVTGALKKAHEIGWKPERYVNTTAVDAESILRPAGKGVAEGVRSVAYFYDVAGDFYDDVEGVKKWREFADGHKIDSHNGIAANAYINAQLVEKALEETDGCTSAALLDAASNLKDFESTLSLPGTMFATAPDMPYAVKALANAQFLDDHWVYGDATVRKGSQ